MPASTMTAASPIADVQQPLSDAACLVAWVTDRDEDALRTLIARYAPMVQGVCRRLVGDGDDADEGAQAGLIAFSRHASSIMRAERIPVWLHRTAQRACARLKRSERRRRHHE